MEREGEGCVCVCAREWRGRERMGVCVRACACVCVREWKGRERMGVCVCVSGRGTERMGKEGLKPPEKQTSFFTGGSSGWR